MLNFSKKTHSVQCCLIGQMVRFVTTVKLSSLFGPHLLYLHLLETTSTAEERVEKLLPLLRRVQIFYLNFAKKNILTFIYLLSIGSNYYFCTC